MSFFGERGVCLLEQDTPGRILAFAKAKFELVPDENALKQVDAFQAGEASHQRAWVQRLREGKNLFRWILSDLHSYLQDQKIFLSENVRGRRFCRALKSLCHDNIVTEADVVLPDLSLAGTARQLLRQLGRSDKARVAEAAAALDEGFGVWDLGCRV